MKVIFSERAYVGILAETTEKIKTETGGLFLGIVDHDQWYIIEAIDPGPKSVFQVAYFEYDQAYAKHLINKVANLYDVKLCLIGLWHRHPGAFDHFSTTDDETNRKYASMRPEGAISVLVNLDPTFRLTVYHVAQPCMYSNVEYEVGNHLIPERLLKYKTPEQYYAIMGNILRRDSISDLAERNSKQMNLHKFMEKITPYLKKYKMAICEIIHEEEQAECILDEIIEDVVYMTDFCGISLFISQVDSGVCLSGDDSDSSIYKIYFKYIKDAERIICFYGKECFEYRKKTFMRCYEKTENIRTIQEQDDDILQRSVFSDAIRLIKKRLKNGDKK